jgi:transposase-like protein
MAGGPVDFQFFDKYERRRPDMDAAIGWLFLQGVSTRRLRSIAQELFGCKVSATTLSRTTGYLDEELRQYQTTYSSLPMIIPSFSWTESLRR